MVDRFDAYAEYFQTCLAPLRSYHNIVAGLVFRLVSLARATLLLHDVVWRKPKEVGGEKSNTELEPIANCTRNPARQTKDILKLLCGLVE